jgi:membrane dipeptidase
MLKRIVRIALIIIAVLLAAFFIFAPGYIDRESNQLIKTDFVASEKAVALHKTLVVADLHADTLMWKRDILVAADHGHVDVPRLAKGNVALQIFSSVTKSPRDQNYDANGSDTDNITALVFGQLQPLRTWTSLLERSLWHGKKLDRAIAGSAGRLVSIRTKQDLAALLATRTQSKPVIGALFSVEGLQNLEGKRENLQKLFAAGVRMAGLAHFFDNEVAGSMHGLKKGGLTPLGRQLIGDMEARGITIDIAHSSHQAVAEILAMVTKPVVSSHGGVQATCKVNRNLTDDEIRGVARTGGVVGIGYWDGAICDTSPKSVAKAIRHVRDLVGINHVGLGSDYDGATTVGFDTADLALVTQALLEEGFTTEEISKVMGGNVFRVLAQTLPG